jgi:guanylate kinase
MAMHPLSFDLYHPQPVLVVISGPSGVGKDAVLQGLKQRGFPLHFVVTATTRPRREGECEGVDYFFVTLDRFKQMIQQDELIEYALVYQDYKGVPKAQIRTALDSGKDVVMRVDVQGAARIRSLLPEAILIFLLPPDEEEWLKRLRERKTETPETLKLRIETAKEELNRTSEYDYLVVNHNGRLDETVDTIASIIIAEHHRVNPRKVTL